jgi:hypothetical protein
MKGHISNTIHPLSEKPFQKRACRTEPIKLVLLQMFQAPLDANLFERLPDFSPNLNRRLPRPPVFPVTAFVN